MLKSRFNTRDASNTPQKMSLKNPFNDEMILDNNDKTIDFYIYGMKSDIARNAMKARDRKYGKIEKLSDEQASRSGAEFLGSLIQGWTENITFLFDDFEGAFPYQRDNAIVLMLEHDWIAAQVSQFALNIQNFDPNASSESGYTSGNSHGSTQSQKSRKEAAPKS
jgi:hypothetical protein